MSTTTTVAGVMTQPVVTAEPDETLSAVAERMHRHRIGSVVVVEGNRPVGILTERDLLRAGASSADPASAVAREWMASDPESVHPDTSIDQALQHLAEHGYRHIPVVVGDELKGIISMRDLMALAHLRPAGELAVTAPPGLKGVVVAETELGDVRGNEGFYHYRQYPAPELAEKRTFEDVWHLLIDGELPTPAERDAFAAEVAPLRSLPAPVLEALPQIALHVPTPVAALRTAISLLAGVEDLPPSFDVDRHQLRAEALRISAALPTIIAAIHRLRQDHEPIAPRDDLPYAANYLYMIDGTGVPDPVRARAMEQYLILGVDHGFNASTFVARAVTSTGADLGAAVVAALCSLSGPLHGGSPSRALDTLDAIGALESTAGWVHAAVASGDRIMGFGHPVYRTADPRSVLLRSVAERIGGEVVELAKQVEAEVERTLAALKPGRELHANIEWYAGVVMDRCGFPRDLFTPTFAASRVVGWCAHALEQHADNRIIRPSSRYVGPPPPQPVPDQ